MADFVFNVGLGRVVEYCNRINSNDPTNSALVLVVIDANGASDATMKDFATLADLLAAAPNEVTNTGYSRKVLPDGANTITITNASDKVEVDIADQTWTAVGAGTAWTDLVICYDADTTTGTDTNIIPLTSHDFAVTPNGGDITFQVNASGFFRAT